MRKIYFLLYRDEKLAWVHSNISDSVFNHVVIGLDKEFREAYGYKAKGGNKVQREQISKYRPDGKCFICSKEITNEQYARLKVYLRSEVGKKYPYDYLGTFFLARIAGPLYHKYGIRVPRVLVKLFLVNPDRRTCGSFVALALKSAGIKLSEQEIKQVPGTLSPYLVTAYTFIRYKELNLAPVYYGVIGGYFFHLEGVRKAPQGLLVGTA